MAPQPIALSRALLTSLFHLPLSEASLRLGLSATSIKKVCRKTGIVKWPYKAKHRGSPTSQQTSSSEAPASRSSSVASSTTTEDATHDAPVPALAWHGCPAADATGQAWASCDTIPPEGVERGEGEDKDAELAQEVANGYRGDGGAAHGAPYRYLWSEAPEPLVSAMDRAWDACPNPALQAGSRTLWQHPQAYGAGPAYAPPPPACDPREGWCAIEEPVWREPSGWSLHGQSCAGQSYAGQSYAGPAW